MMQEPYYADLVKAILQDSDLRRSCLEDLIAELPHSSAPERPTDWETKLFQRFLDAHVPLKTQDPVVDSGELVAAEADREPVVVAVASYPLHKITERLPFGSPPPRFHENELDSIVYCCLRLVLAPLIQDNVVHALGRGYHKYWLAYDPKLLKPKVLENPSDTFPSVEALIALLESQRDARDHETEELVEILHKIARRPVAKRRR